MTPITDDMVDLKPCPFCGGKAKLLGGPMAQETYSVWCDNSHSICGTMDKDETVRRWNTRAALEGSVAVPAITLGSIVEMRSDAPFASDWRGVTMKVVSLRIEPDGHQWVSVIEGGPRHRGNGVYDSETTDIDIDHLQIASALPRQERGAV